MSIENKLALLEIPEGERLQLIKQVRMKLRQKALEAKMWQWLLQVDNLTINGNIVWEEKQQTNSPNVKRKRKK